MIKINEIVLNPNMSWEEQGQSSGIIQTAKKTLGGRQVISVASETGGRNVTLVASEGSGWLTKSQVDAIMVLANTPGAVVSVTFYDELVASLAVFRHHEAPAAAFMPLLRKNQPHGGDHFIGTLKLMTI